MGISSIISSYFTAAGMGFAAGDFLANGEGSNWEKFDFPFPGVKRLG